MKTTTSNNKLQGKNVITTIIFQHLLVLGTLRSQMQTFSNNKKNSAKIKEVFVVAVLHIHTDTHL